MILAGIAANRIDLGHPGDRPHLRTHHPVVQGPQVGRRPCRAVGLLRTRLGLDRIHEDFAEPGRDRAHLRLDAGGKLRLDRLKAFVDQLPREIGVGAVLEHNGHLAKAVAGDRAGVVQPRYPGDGGLYGESDTLFGLERRIAFGLGVDLHLNIGDVGHCVDRQARCAPHAQSGKGSNDSEHHPALADRKSDDTGKHVSVLPDQWSWLAPDFSTSARMRKAPLAA